MTMKKQGKSKAAERPAAGRKTPVSMQAADKFTNPGANQPHNAKKEGLGPNTDRNA